MRQCCFPNIRKLFEIVRNVHLMDYGLFLVAPDIPGLRCSAGECRDLRLFTFHTVSDALLQGTIQGIFLCFVIWRERFPHQTMPGGRLLASGFCLVSEFAATV
jgi:hypothetical protein